MHGHLPQQHPGMLPASHHQPPPHLTHLANLPPHSIPRDHHANRLNSGPRHHHPRAVEQHQAAGGMAPHHPMQGPPPPHQPQNPRKPPGGPPAYYANGGIHGGGGLPKPLPLTAAHMHAPPPPPPGMPPQQQQQQQQHPPPGPMPLQTVGKLPYGMGTMGQHGKQQQQQQQHQPPVSVHHSVAMAPPVQASIPVVSAATPAGTKTRHIPSSTDHKIHHHSQHSTMHSNGGSGGPGSKGALVQHHPAVQHGGSTRETSAKSAAASGGSSRHQQQQPPPHQHHQSTKTGNDSASHPSKDSASAAPSVPAPTDGASANGTASGADATATTTNTTTTMATTTTTAAAQATTTLSSSNSLETLANIKEKTTMCLVNELARYNKIQHQYRLTGESGPAHKKRFTVTLKLGDEEYTAEGASIKKAQHKAAGDAIAETKYKHPPARTKPRAKTGPRGNVSSFTPTVELNALAMKRGEPTVYQVKAVPLPAAKYPPTGPAATGRRPGDKLPPQAAQPGLGVGYGGRYGHPNGGDSWGRAGAPGLAGVVAGVGGRGGMGGFHPGHQQQQQQQQQQPPPPHHHHAHHSRAGGLDDHHHHLQHHHPHGGHHHAHHGQLHHHSAYHHHNEGSAGSGYGHPPVMPVQEFYKATLRVGERTFLGEGHSPQAARHDAAARALEVLKPLTAEAAAAAAEGKGRAGGDADGNDDEDGGGGGGDGDPNAELKSPISLVHEMAVQRNVPVVFEVISEKGPPHMTVFVTQCKVGTLVTEGEGTGKKPSKKRAAEKMLEELRKLQKAEQQSAYPAWGADGGGAGEKRKAHPKATAAGGSAAQASSPPDAGIAVKKKARNLIKEKPVAGDVGAEKENPISRLMQIQQARKEKQPVYTLVENERPNVGRRRQFTIEVSVAGKSATGVGMTKKAAKWNAAEALLVDMGYATAPATTTTTTMKSAGANVSNGTANKENQSGAANEAPSRKFIEGVETASKTSNGTDSRVPLGGGNQATASHHGKNDTGKDSMNDSTASNDSMATNSSGVSSASSAAPASAAAPTIASSPSAPSNSDFGRNKEQLLYLAQLLKFEVQFSDFPKGNHGQYLTLVVLSTEPPQLCHGSGASLQESQDEAARGALEMLSQIGLDNVKPKAPAVTSSTADSGSIAAVSSSTAVADGGGK